MQQDEFTDIVVVCPRLNKVLVNRRVVSGGDEAYYMKEVDQLVGEMEEFWPDKLVLTEVGNYYDED